MVCMRRARSGLYGESPQWFVWGRHPQWFVWGEPAVLCMGTAAVDASASAGRRSIIEPTSQRSHRASGNQANLRLSTENALIFPIQSTQSHSLFHHNRQHPSYQYRYRFPWKSVESSTDFHGLYVLLSAFISYQFT